MDPALWLASWDNIDDCDETAVAVLPVGVVFELRVPTTWIVEREWLRVERIKVNGGALWLTEARTVRSDAQILAAFQEGRLRPSTA